MLYQLKGIIAIDRTGETAESLSVHSSWFDFENEDAAVKWFKDYARAHHLQGAFHVYAAPNGLGGCEKTEIIHVHSFFTFESWI